MSSPGTELTLYAYPQSVSTRQPIRLTGVFLNWKCTLIGGENVCFPVALPNRTISLYRNGVSTGLTDVTDSGGGYEFNITEQTIGNYDYNTTGNGEVSPTRTVTVTVAPVNTTITMTASKTNLAVGENIQLTGTILDNWGNPVINDVAHIFVEIADSGLNGVTDDSGNYVIIFPVGLYGPGNYNVEARFLGSGTLMPSNSLITAITIMGAGYALSINSSPISGVSPVTILVTGTFSSGGSGIYPALITLLVNGSSVATAPTNYSGNYTIQYTITGSGTYSIQTGAITGGYNTYSPQTSVTVTPTGTQQWAIAISSTLIPVTFTIAGAPQSTPYTDTLNAGQYALVAPSPVTVDNIKYAFNRWSDGVLTKSRSFDLNKNSSLAIEYYATTECVVTTDCPEGMFCQDGVCTYPPQEDYTWIILAGIGTALIGGTIILLRRRKRKE